MGRRWRPSPRNVGTASVGIDCALGAQLHGEGREEERARKRIPPLPSPQGTRHLTGAERTPGGLAPSGRRDEAMTSPTSERCPLLTQQAGFILITTASPWVLWGHFCSINLTCFHIELLISYSQSWLQGTYNYRHFIVGETGPREEEEYVWATKTVPRSPLT